MSYALGIDMGTTYTAAAVVKDARVEMVSLATHAVVVPTVAWMGSEGDFLVGSSAERRGVTEPGRLTRFFKRRFGDTAPLVLGSAPISIEHVTAEVLGWVERQVGQQEGTPPGSVAIAHPAGWGEYKLDLLRQAAAEAGVADAMLVSEPVAAAIHYADQREFAAGDLVAVYDFGGGTFDASVLRCTGDGFELAGKPDGIERLGGIDLDAAVLAHVLRSVGREDAVEADATDSAATRLREECRAAKEALSEDSETSISYVDERGEQLVRLTRSEFEEMCRAPIRQTISTTSRVIGAAGIVPGDLTAVLLVGGSSRIPLVSEMVSAEFGRPVAVDAHPKHAVALGAARVASRPGMDGVTGTVPVVAAAASGAAAGALAGHNHSEDHPYPVPDVDGATGAPDGSASPYPVPQTGRQAALGSRATLIAGAAVAAALVAGLLTWLLWPDSDEPVVERTPLALECCPLAGGGFPAGALPVAPALAGSSAGVGVRSFEDGSIWAFSATEFEVTSSEATSIGGGPTEMIAIDGADGPELWVTDVRENRIVALSAESLEPIQAVEVGSEPQGIAQASDGTLWVANTGDDTVTVVDPVARSTVSTLDVPSGPSTVTSAGSTVWVSSTGDGSVSALDVESRSLVETVEVGSGPLTVRAVGGWVLVADAKSGSVSVLDSETPEAEPRSVDTSGAVFIAESTVTDRVAVATGDDAGVALVDPDTATVEGFLTGSEMPAAVLETSTDAAQIVWVSDFAKGSVIAYPTGSVNESLDSSAGGTISDIGERSISVGGSPRWIAQVPGGVAVELFPGNQVAFIDEQTFEVTLLSPGRSGPLVTTDTTDDTKVTVTSPPEIGFVHNVVGTTEVEARAILGEEGFSVSTVFRSSEEVAEGLVITTDPAPLTELEKGSTVRIVVSSGPAGPVTAPDTTDPPG